MKVVYVLYVPAACLGLGPDQTAPLVCARSYGCL
jgi:hypothetical protein